MRKIVLLACTWAALAKAQGPSPDESWLVKGRFEEIVQAVAPTSTTTVANHLLRARALVALGRWREVIEATEHVLARRDPSATERDAATWLWGAACIAIGDLKRVVAKVSDLRPATAGVWITAYLLRGERKLAAPQIRALLEANRQGTLDVGNAYALRSLAVAARAERKTELANDALSAAARLMPDDAELAIERASLFWEKYSESNATRTLQALLVKQPRVAAAHGLLALVILDSTYDVKAARTAIAAAFAIDSLAAHAWYARGLLALDDHDWPGVAAAIDALLRTNAHDPRGLALRATAAWIRDESVAFAATKAAHQQHTPGDTTLLRTLLRSAVREHRYDDGNKFALEALRADPTDADAMAELGLGYLRLGDEKQGLSWLRKAHAADGYHVRAFNTLTLFEDTIPEQYTAFTTPHFRFRIHKDATTVTRRVIAPFLEQAFADMTKRYGKQPPTPITIELYDNAEDYAVRTVGMPRLAALGVCFGRVITALAPSQGNINWGMVLYHELAHVFAIDLSRSRVPRWYTEGLSEVETMRARPEWRRENNAELAAALGAGTLPTLGELSKQFTQGDVVVAYYLSALWMEYLVDRFGYPAIVRGLAAFASSKDTEQAMRDVTGHSLSDLETAFRADLIARLASHRRQYALPKLSESLPELAALAQAKGATAEAKARYALGIMQAGEEGAGTWIAQALATSPVEPLALYLQAMDAAQRNDANAETLLQGLAQRGIDNTAIRAELADHAMARGDRNAAIGHWCAAKRLAPDESRPYAELAALYEQAGDEENRLRELATYAMLEQMEVGPPKTLALAYGKALAFQPAETFAQLALFITPSDTELWMVRGAAALGLQQPTQALSYYEIALAIEEPASARLRRPAQAHVGRARAYLALGKHREAKAALADAALLEPESADVAELSKSLP